MWNDKSIPTRAKSEVIRLFNKAFGFALESNDSFRIRINGTFPPTPAQEDYLEEIITLYWNRYNQTQTSL